MKRRFYTYIIAENYGKRILELLFNCTYRKWNLRKVINKFEYKLIRESFFHTKFLNYITVRLKLLKEKFQLK